MQPRLFYVSENEHKQKYSKQSDLKTLSKYKLYDEKVCLTVII